MAMHAQTKLAPLNVLDKTPAGKTNKSSRSHKMTALINKEKAKIAEADEGENKSSSSSNTSISPNKKGITILTWFLPPTSCTSTTDWNVPKTQDS